jgi:hypothetical protein
MVIIRTMNTTLMDARLAEKNKNQKEMAEEIGMNPARLSDMKSRRLKGWKYRSRISRYLGVPEEDLFDDNDHQNSCQQKP